MSEFTGKIHSIESCGTVDGPGLRCVVFMHGCSLRCRYCHNPDTWATEEYAEVSVEVLFNKVKRYQPYFRAAGGGVTVSGGEPTLQAPFVAEFFRRCQVEGIHTALDTSGWTSIEDLARVLDYTKLVLLDIKHIDPTVHRRLTGQDNAKVFATAEYIAQRKIPLWVRHVLVPGYTDGEKDLRELGWFLAQLPNLELVELLPYHRLGVHKWESLGLEYTMRDVQPPEPEEVERAKGILTSFNLPVC